MRTDGRWKRHGEANSRFSKYCECAHKVFPSMQEMALPWPFFPPNQKGQMQTGAARKLSSRSQYQFLPTERTAGICSVPYTLQLQCVLTVKGCSVMKGLDMAQKTFVGSTFGGEGVLWPSRWQIAFAFWEEGERSGYTLGCCDRASSAKCEERKTNKM